jgi:hypothetical protein
MKKQELKLIDAAEDKDPLLFSYVYNEGTPYVMVCDIRGIVGCGEDLFIADYDPAQYTPINSADLISDTVICLMGKKNRKKK